MTTQRIRRLESPALRNIPIIAMTANANAFDEDRTKALASGMKGHLARPIDISRLTETLAAALK